MSTQSATSSTSMPALDSSLSPVLTSTSALSSTDAAANSAAHAVVSAFVSHSPGSSGRNSPLTDRVEQFDETVNAG